MLNSNEILKFAYVNEYESAYDLSQPKLFSKPKIYTAKGDLTRRWHIYFSFRNPDTGKLKRMTPFYGEANKYKTKEERLEVLTIYRKALLKLLKLGYNPFVDNTELYKKLNRKKGPLPTNKISEVLKEGDTSYEKEKTKMSIRDAFDFGIKMKEKVINTTTKKGYKNRVRTFIKWLEENHPDINNIEKLDKRIVVQFLNHILLKTSARNRNNYRTDLSSIVQVLEDNDIIMSNMVKKTPVLKSSPERNKTYSKDTQEQIFTYLEKEDPILLLYIKFISYNFLRPIEVCRLKVGSIDIGSQTLKVKAKNSPLKTKIIPDILLKELPDLSNIDPEADLFTPNKIAGFWDTDMNNRRDYFSKRFKRVVKDKFGLGKDYGLYSFRHTYITMLYRAIVKQSSPFEAKSKLMLITGHSTMTALEKYLRDIDAELPEDYSEMLKQ
ncbi:site-specific integrase [Hyunsoonleella flava]|uniref:Site-specific integrase n=1 Tax=Hyunsoonleella flava TaxID=2527939 RepID=A0A4Q9FE33_9FLAO|nr:site-specific integrase [Hyunsoonleella flava]TBN04452.1 site-specific integrase [Hyunsoonleella flava]